MWSRDGAYAVIYDQSFRGYGVKTLVIRFPSVRRALSTMEGFKEVLYVCNNYAPRELWGYLHESSSNRLEYFSELMGQLGLNINDGACLGIGVDMDYLAVSSAEHGRIWVTVFATAGVRSNAMRVGFDEAQCEEDGGKFTCRSNGEGTINIIVITNAKLTDGAMAGALVTITEAKVAALQDLNVRSSYNRDYQATGTGTDNVIVVSGTENPVITYSGGHAKFGEVMARATYWAVRSALVRYGF
ncbi:adenosylcobinamide amidohydrolase [Vulcanisaeta sp. JCM 16161]